VGAAAHGAPWVSIRVRNFATNHLKVNDADGPVEIAAIVVWQVAAESRSDSRSACESQW
jgi:hypothetical protein